MSIDKKIINEIERYNKINNYINEQEEAGDELPPLPDTEEGDVADDLGGDLGGEENVDEVPEPVDVENDPDVEVIGDEGSEEITDEGGTEELDVTELVTTQKEISDKQDEYMETMFSKLDDLTSKLSEMDLILNKINDLEQKVEKYRQKSPEEKLQLRSLDSYPYNQKLTDFFMEKKDEMDQTGKNTIVLT